MLVTGVVVALSAANEASPPEAENKGYGQIQAWPEILPDFFRERLAQPEIPADANAGLATTITDARLQLIFVDFYTEWCAPCKLMDRKVIPDPRVQRELEHWTVVKVDRDRFPQLAKAFVVTGLPSYFLVSADGRILDKLVGIQIPQDFADWLSENRKKLQN